MIKINQQVKFESTHTHGRWFTGKVYAIVDKYALVTTDKDLHFTVMYPQFVALDRLSAL